MLQDQDLSSEEAVHSRKVPLSYAQQRLWFLDRLEGPNAAYNVTLAARLKGRLDRQALHAAITDVVARHESLRTVFPDHAEKTWQQVLPPSAIKVKLDIAEASEDGLDQALLEASRYCFDLANEIPFKACLFKLDEEVHVLLLLVHHIAGDGWSMAPLTHDIGLAYAARLEGKVPTWAPLPVQYVDYTLWQNELLGGEHDPNSTMVRQLAYWRKRLSGMPELLDLPLAKPRPAVQSYRGESLNFHIDEALYQRLQKLARESRATLFMLLQAAVSVLFTRLGAGNDIPMGSAIGGRTDDALHDLVGYFANTIVLRNDTSGNPSFRELLARVRKSSLEAYKHQDLPFDRLVEALSPKRSLAHHPLIQVMLLLQNINEAVFDFPGLAASSQPVALPASKFDLTFNMTEVKGEDGRMAGMSGIIEYTSDLYDRETVHLLAKRLVRILEAAADEPDAYIGSINLLDGDELAQILETWNATDADYPLGMAQHVLFEEQAQKTPEHVAVLFEGREVTYRELNERANRLAHYLTGQGVGPDALVGLCMERSVEMVVSLYGILKAGGAYVPLDPAYPKDRLRYMVEDAKPCMLLTQEHLAEEWAHAGTPVFCLDSQWEEIAGYPVGNPSCATQPGNLAYVIYTSGSTGKPKGVSIPHGSLTNFIHAMKCEPGINQEDVLLSVTSLSFDIAALEIFLPLTSGATVMLVSRETAGNPQQLSDLIRTQNVTMMQATPSTWRMLVEHGWPRQARPLKALCGGEALQVDLAQRMLAHIPAIWNMYGPTETTIWSALRCVARDADISIGRPIANTQIYLLDEYLNPVPVGVAGDAYIAGDGLARGYLNRPELTADRFIPNPFGKVPGARMYKTGDLARYLPDGNIEYLGRNDFQVKIRGFRIELGEIEAKLTACEGVREAVVMAREDVPGDKRIVAYVVGRQGQVPQTGELRAALLASLPEYMVPSHFVALEKMPLTPNGKVDRKALPAPDMTSDEVSYEPPQGEVEQALADIWAEVLKRDRIGRHDNFFGLGGHSLLATTVIVKIRARFRIDLPIRFMFEAPTIESLAKKLNATKKGQEARMGEAVPELRGEGSWIALDENLSKLESRSPSSRNVFLIPGRGGSIEIFHGLARHLIAENVNVFVLHYDGVDNDKEPLGNILSISEKYAPQVMRHCRGETVIAGYCVGGTIAYELAKSLHKKGISSLKVAFIDTVIPKKIDTVPSFDPLRFKSEFFKAICDTYTRTSGEMIAYVFDRLSEEQCIDYAVSKMELKSRLEVDSWKSILRRRYEAEKAHFLAILEYWENTIAQLAADEGKNPEPAGFSLKIIETSGMRNGRAMSTLAEMGVTETLVEMVDGEHLTVMKRHHDQVANALLSYMEYPFRRSKTDDDGLAKHIDRQGPFTGVIVPLQRNRMLPLSYAQRRLWFLDQFEPGSPLYNIPCVFQLIGKLDKAALERSLNEITKRHEALRTVFAVKGEEPVQVILPHRPLALVDTDLSSLPAQEREAQAHRLVPDEARRPFDLAQGPLIRAQLITLAAQEHLLLLTMHHIVSDGWSIGVLLNELSVVYSAYHQGQASPLPELHIQYADYAHWQQQWLTGEVLQQQLDYWKQQLQGAPTLLSLPTDRPRPTVQSQRGAMVEFDIPEPIGSRLQALSRQNQCTLFMTLTAAFSLLLSRYSGQQDICIGTPIANRNRSEIEPLIGFFVNTLVLRTQIDQQSSFEALLSQVREMTLGAYSHQDVPFEQLVEILNPERHTSHSPLFQVMLTLQNATGMQAQLAELECHPVTIPSTVAKFDLTLGMSETPSGLKGGFEYNTDLFDRKTVERGAGHFARLLEAIAEMPRSPIGELMMLGQAERRQLLEEWNDTHSAYPKDKAIHELFEAQVEKTPEHTAVAYEGQALTYRELNELANRLAHYLVKERGVGPDVLVGLCVERSPALMVGILGILKAGGAYVPLDPDYPKERLVYMLEDAQLHTVITQARLTEKLPLAQGQGVILDDAGLQARLKTQLPLNLDVKGRGLGPDHLAYVIYTSGSTGRPKGVMVPHRGLCNLAWAQADTFRVSPTSRVLQFASISFDAAAWEWVMALSQGAALVLVSQETVRSPEALSAFVAHNRISHATLPPVLLGMLDKSRWRSVEMLTLAGESCPMQVADEWSDVCQLINAYGPTEATVCATMNMHRKGESKFHIGKPLQNIQTYVLDAAQVPVPVGVVGELYMGGVSVARGYLNRPELTAEKFIINPFYDSSKASSSERLYRTGDLVRWLEDGNLEFIGRADEQVKIRGFRIELGEIEARLSACAGVREAVVMAREDAPGDKRIVAYVAGSEGQILQAGELRAALLGSLPEYMVPSYFVMLDKLPLTPNGKVDRKALPAPDTSTHLASDYEPPHGEAEQALAEIWAEVLKRDRIGRHDNFFGLGGHSLLATTVIVKIRARFQIDLPIRALFGAPTIESLAKTLNVTERGREMLKDEAAAEDSEGSWIALDENLSRLESRSSSSRKVFLIPGGGGSTEVFHALAGHLAVKDINVFVLHYDGVDNENEPLGDIFSIAEKYAQQVMRHCHGETVMAGYCIGGVIAYEMGRILHKNGVSQLKVAFIDTGIPQKTDPEPPFDPLRFKSEFFKAICDTYTRTSGEKVAHVFDGLSEEECIDYAVSKMELRCRLEADSWKGILRRRYEAERAHNLAIRAYWGSTLARLIANEGKHPEYAGFPLKRIETPGLHDERAVITLAEMGLAETMLATVDGEHLTVLKRHHDQVANALLWYMERPLRHMNTDDLRESVSLSES